MSRLNKHEEFPTGTISRSQIATEINEQVGLIESGLTDDGEQGDYTIERLHPNDSRLTYKICYFFAKEWGRISQIHDDDERTEAQTAFLSKYVAKYNLVRKANPQRALQALAQKGQKIK